MSRSKLTYTELGPKAPETAETLQAQVDVWQEAFEHRLNPDPATPQGQLMASLAAIVQDKNSQLLYLANQFNPATASGVWQDALGAIYFLDRQSALPTVVQVTCTGLAGTVIPGLATSPTPAQVKTDKGNVLVCQTGGIIPPEGEITLPFAAVDTGPVVAPHSVTRIVEAIPGWDTVDNAAAGVTGRSVESRQAFELRRAQSVALNSRGQLASVYARVAELEGVLDVLARQNRTDAAVQDNGVELGPHSIYICVLGGDDQAIAAAIYDSVSAGCDYNGSTSVVHTDPLTGAKERVRFERPAEVPFAITVTLQANASTPADIEARVKANVLADFYGEPYPNAGDGLAHNTDAVRIPIGAKVYASRFLCPAISAGATQLESVTIARKNGPAGNIVELSNKEYPSLIATDITVTVKPVGGA